MIRRIFSQPQTNSIPERYRLLAVVIHLGTLTVAALSWIIGRPPSAPLLNQQPIIRFAIVALVIICLLLLDLRTINHHGLKLSPNEKGRHLIVRILLLTIAIVMAGLELTAFVYLLLSLYAYLTMGRRAALIVAGCSFIVLFLRLAYGPRNNFISAGDVEQLHFC